MSKANEREDGNGEEAVSGRRERGWEVDAAGWSTRYLARTWKEGS